MLGLVGLFVVWVWGKLHPGSHPFATLIRDGLIIAGLAVAYRVAVARVNTARESHAAVPASVATSLDPLGSVRGQAAAVGGGAYRRSQTQRHDG